MYGSIAETAALTKRTLVANIEIINCLSEPLRDKIAKKFLDCQGNKF